MTKKKSKTEQPKGLKLLFADDEPSLQELMKLELPRMGHTVTVCPDGETAVAALQKNSYDCLMVDIDMLKQANDTYGHLIGDNVIKGVANLLQQGARMGDMVARYVIPEVNGMLEGYRESQRYVIENREVFDRAGEAIMAKIMENDKAVAAMQQQADGEECGITTPTERNYCSRHS